MANTTSGKPATIYDVARAAGVSHQTVSRVLKGSDAVRPETRDKVQEALRVLRYRPNRGARELSLPSPPRIGIVGYETFQSSTSRVLAGIDAVARQKGYRLDIVNVDPLDSPSHIATLLETLNASDVVGVLATSPTENVRLGLKAVKFDMPVYVDVNGGELEDLEGERRTSRVARKAMEFLVHMGHRRIAFVGGPLSWDAASSRERVYLDTMAELGEPANILGRGDWSAKSGYEAAKALFDPSEATAVFVANDRMCLGVMRALHEAKIGIPDQISVIGIDDIPEAAYFCPPLTTVRVNFEQSGAAAMRSLISIINDSKVQASGGISYELIVRQSVTPVQS